MPDIGGQYYRVNQVQSAQERREKYRYLRDCGFSKAWADRARDWNWWAIQRLIAHHCDVTAVCGEA